LEADFNDDIDDDVISAVMDDYDTNKHNYDMFPFPPTWDDVYDTSKQVTAPMHTLGPGIVKNTIGMTLDFSSQRNKKATFLKQSGLLLDYIADMKLDWCKVFSVETDKFGGWVSENWCSYARIAKWTYSMLDCVAPDFQFDIPETPVECWTTAQCKGYLKYYDLPFGKTAFETRCKAAEAYHDDNILKVPPHERGGSVEQVEEVIEAMAATFSLLMQKEIDDDTIVQCDRHLKIFLHRLHNLDISLSSTGKKSATGKTRLETSYSYLAALQLVYVVERYGSLRNVWEGSFAGEGILQEVKPLIKDLRTNWHLNAGRKHFTQKVMKKLMKEYGNSCSPPYLRNDHCVYGTVDDALSLFMNNKPLSILQLSCGTYVVVISNDKFMQLSKKKWFISVCGLSYFKWSICNTAESIFFLGVMLHISVYSYLI